MRVVGQAHLVLSARVWWCRPGERIVWAVLDPFRAPMFQVGGLTEHGKRKRALPVRAAFQVGAAGFRVTDFLNGDSADQRSRPSVVVAGRSPDALAARLAGIDGKSVPGGLPGVLVATSERLGMLRLAEKPGGTPEWQNNGWVRKVKKAAAPVMNVGDDFAGTMMSHSNLRHRTFDHGERTRTPEVVEVGAVPTGQITGCEIAGRGFHKLGYEKDQRFGHYLVVSFADASELALELPERADPGRVSATGCSTTSSTTSSSTS